MIAAHVTGNQASAMMPPLPPNGNSSNGKRSHHKNGARPKSLASQNSNNHPNNFHSSPQHGVLHHSGSSPQIVHHSAAAAAHRIQNMKTSPSSPASLSHLSHPQNNPSPYSLYSQPIPENPPERPPLPVTMESAYYGIPAIIRQNSGPSAYGYSDRMMPIHLDTKVTAADFRVEFQKQNSLPESRSAKELASKKVKEPLYQNAVNVNLTYGTVPPSPPSSRHAFQHHGAVPKVQYIPNIPVTEYQETKRKETPKLNNVPSHHVNKMASKSHGSSPKVVSGKGGPGKSSSGRKKRTGGENSPPPLPPPPATDYQPPTPPVRKESAKLAMVGPLNPSSIQSQTAHITPSMNGLPASPAKDTNTKPLHPSENSAFTPVTPQGSPQRKVKKVQEEPKQQQKHQAAALKMPPPAATSAGKHGSSANSPGGSKIPKLNRSPATPSSIKSDSRLLKHQHKHHHHHHHHDTGAGAAGPRRKPVEGSPRNKAMGGTGAGNATKDQGTPQGAGSAAAAAGAAAATGALKKPQTEPSTSESEAEYQSTRGPKVRPPAPPFQVKRRQRVNPPPRLSRSLDYIPSDLEDAASSSFSSRAESPLNAPRFPILDPEAFMPISALVKQLADNISISSMGSGMSSEMSRSDSNLNYDSGSAAYESEYDNYRPGMASDEDYFVPEPISDVDIDMFDDIIDNVTVSDTYDLDMPMAFLGPKKITDV